MQKWTNTSAGKIQCNRFSKAWSALNWEHNTVTQLSGVIGQSERSCTIIHLCGSDKRADITAAQEAIGARFGWTVTAQNVNEIIKAVEEATAAAVKSRPIEDNRETPEAVTERANEYAKRQAESTAKAEESKQAFIAHFGSGGTATVQPGQMAVIAKICYDNSDTMSDYFDRHASLSQSFALLVVPKQAETERLARRGAAVSPLLAAIEFDWHTEKYSMGHGNYLESKSGFELPAELQNLRERYRGSGITHAHWEITFAPAYREAFELDTIAGYGQQPPKPDESGSVSVSDVTVTENTEKGGIEIRFPSKPDPVVIDSLKANGWRWSRFSQCWYTRGTDRARQFAASLGRSTETEEQENGAAPAPPPTRRELIPDDVLDVLRLADFTTDSVKLNGQLDRDLYLKVNKTLETVGGKWNRGRKCHVFGQDPRQVLGIEEGRINPHALNSQAIEKMVENGTQARAISQLFPTPPELAARMVEEAQIPQEASVLEPSVGTGNIAKAVFECRPCHITAVEINGQVLESFRQSYRVCGHYDNSRITIVQGDFLEQNGNLGKFDRVVMNPPFINGADIKHIKHALTFLKPGGRLVALCANGSRQREILKPLAEESGGWWEDLPAGTFKEQGTNVNTALLVIEAPE